MYLFKILCCRSFCEHTFFPGSLIPLQFVSEDTEYFIFNLHPSTKQNKIIIIKKTHEKTNAKFNSF